MPFTDPVSSVSGRNSRASNVSGVTGASQSVRSQRMAVPPADTLNAGVLSMLKTSTDTGDIGALSFNSSRLPNMPRATHQRRGHHGHGPRLSGGSGPSAISSHHHYPSQTSKVSSAREWDSMSNQRRGSLTSMQSMPPSLPPVHLAKGPLQMPPPPDRPRDSRSYSLTSAPPVPQLPRHRSQSSLKSQGHEPRHQPYARTGPPPPMAMQDNRPPYVYPTRLKRPGYRSPSPALSDTHSQGPPPPLPGGPPMPARRPPMTRPPPQTYNSDYGPDYGNDPRHLNVRGPPSRAMSNSPMMGYTEAPPPGQLPYRHPMAMRSAPGLALSPYAGHPPPPGAYPGPSQQHMPHQPQIHRPPYGGPPRSHCPAGPGYPPYLPLGHQHPSMRSPPPQNPHVAPAAHNLFHSAARMARQLPHRTDTPMTDTGPPSSDPPSSGTAPTSSSPPTPRDQTSIQVVVDPAFIDPALADLQDSSSEPVLPHQYFQYADGLVDKDVDETEVDVVHPSIPQTGFVQRVRAMLESKAAAEAAAKHEIERERSPQPQVIHEEEDIADMHVEIEHAEIHELAADEEYRFTMIEEFAAPVELPASPVRIAELGGSPIQVNRRITRDMVKAELKPSSADNTAFEIDATDESIMAGEPKPPRPPRASQESKRTDPFADVIKMDETAPSTPAAPKTTAPAEQSPESATTSSPETLGISAVDYATRFSTAAESATNPDETQSKDPFVLDADTITLQHQRSKEKIAQPEATSAEKPAKTATDEPCTEVEQPVSPLLTGEDVSRDSAVSPLRTQTLGIDETLHMATETRNDEETETSADLTVPDASGALPSPTPRTPKTYSKSVQLQPNSSLTEDATPNSNRFSLPPDLSTVGDTTMNTTSDMVTDVAVRFSLPSTTVTITKPQIIEIPPSSSPPAPPPKPKPAMHASNAKGKRNSVTFADEVVAPLKINKQAEHHTAEGRPEESRISKGKAIARRPSPLQENIDSRAQRDATTDLRFSNLHGINSRFGSTHLPGLKEESVEEMSISNKHASDRTCKSEFPLPARIAAVKAMQERRLQESAEKARARRAHRHPNRPLAETRDLPSLNFSRMDLIEKLNEALEVRSSKSMEVMRRREFAGIYCPSPQRPQSTEPFRERYTSFFNKPEDFPSFFAAQDPSDDEEESSTRPVSPKDTGVPTVEVQPNTEVELEESGLRPLSPEDFLSVATQVERLSIPSVAGLSERLSEILPNLHDLQLDKVLSGFSSISDDFGRLDAMRPGTVLSTRTSAGFRTLAERAEEIVKNGTHDSTVPANRLLAHKELTGLLPSASADQVSALILNHNKQSYLSGSTSAPTDLGTDPMRPESVMTTRKSPTCIEEVNQLLPPEMNPITRSAKRALISSGSSRPWNQDENYPWAGTKVDVDLSVPSEAHSGNSLTAEAIRRRKTKSLDLNSAGEPTDTSKGIDIGSILEYDTTGEITDEQLTGIPHTHQRKQSKRSLIGSITKKMGLGSSTSGNTTRTIPSPMAKSATDVRGSLPHRPGERYPTSSLTPPAAFNLDEVRSYFSDNSSEKEHNASLRKRLTNFKSKGKSVRLQSHHNNRSHTPEQSRTQSAVDVNDTTTTYDAGSTSMAIGDRLMGACSSANTYDGVGMGKTEFRIKRFGEKLRHLVARGGELIRSWSQRSRVPRAGSRNERVRDDWLSDSLYSGV